MSTTSDLGEITVKNPYGVRLPDLTVRRGELRYDEPRETLIRTLRDDPLGRLHDRGQIDEPEYAAGRTMQGLYEAAEVGKLKSSGDWHEPVDTGNRVPDILTDGQDKALRRLAKVNVVLGKDAATFVRRILAERKFIKDIAREMGDESKACKERLGKLFRGCLTALAVEFGYRTAA